MTVRLLVADDHGMVREALDMFFQGDPLVEIVGTAPASLPGCRSIAEQAQHAGAFPPHAIAHFAANEDVCRGHERFEPDGRPHLADRDAHVVDDRRD